MQTTITHAPLTRRSEIVIVLDGGDIEQREAMARAIIAQLATCPPAPPPPGTPALTPLFALLSEPNADPPLLQTLPTLAAPFHPTAAYDEPFMLAPLDEDR